MRTPPDLRRRTRPRTALTAVGTLSLGALLLAACSSSPAAHTAATGLKATSTTTTTTAPPPPPSCPLTGQPVPAGAPVPARPALAVKVDNYPQARPQSGLDKADIVFEEPVEGGITRLAAVFQCQDAASVGPIRSARNIDIGILGQLGTPLEVHVGGINPVLANINASPIVNVDLGAYGGIASHPSGRFAPYDTYSTTAQMWGTHPTMTTPPQALFSYSTAPPTGTAAGTVHIPFSGTSDVTWKYNKIFGVFQRFYNGTAPDMLADNVQTSAANVVVQYVAISYGPWLENSSSSSLEVQAAMYPSANGNAVIYRNGVAIPATWHRSTLGAPTVFLDSASKPIYLTPGQTWVELVPNTITATTTP
jgi:hypothetical protein